MGCGKSKDGVHDPTDVIEPNLTEIKETTDQKPKQILKDIDKFYAIYKEKRDSLKPFISERTGLQALLDEEREKLLNILTKKDKAYKERAPLLVYTWERDADDIFRAFGSFSLDKETLVSIFMNRSKWQIEEIANVFRKKYGKDLLVFVISEMTTIVGTLATGGNTGLGKLLSYRIMLQPDRDAAFLRDCTDGISLNDEALIEILTTRTNSELKGAIAAYFRDYKKDLIEIIRNKASYKNYRDFLLAILECSRDETNEPLDDHSATQFANELYEAGAARSLGIDAGPFIRIIPYISYVQFESINRKYPDQRLLNDISAKLGGDFAMAVIARCTDKYEYLARKIDKALKGFSTDKDTLCRIIGSLKRQECIRLRDAYDRLKLSGPTSKSLEQMFRSTLSGNFQKAMLDSINSDPALNPIGTDVEISDLDQEAEIEGERQKKVAEQSYRSEKAIAKGEEILRKKARGKIPKLEDSHKEGEPDEPPSDAISANNINLVVDEYEDEIPQYNWDPIRGRFMDVAKLAKELKDCQQATKDVLLLRERISDEINGIKDVYLSIIKSCAEAEVLTAQYTTQIRRLKAFIDARDAESRSNKSKK